MSRRVLASLRDFVPIRSLTRAEALRIAEMQATRFLKLLDITEPPVTEEAIAELPRIDVQHIGGLPVSGATQWSHGRWLVLLKGSEPVVRQRFSLAHEFKHIIDHRFIDILYQAIPERERAAFIEQVCDYFAGSLLIPRPWLKRAFGQGIQLPRDLAQHFNVSQAAIEVRLAQTGLGDRRARCNRTAPNWSLPASPRPGTPEGYRRLTTPVPT